MSINFGLLGKLATPGVIAQPQQQPTPDDSIGDLFSGIKALIGTRGGSERPDVPNATYGASYNQPTLQMAAAQSVSQNMGIFNSALKQMGMKEGDQTLNSYLQKANPNLDPSKTPWCAGFVGSVLNANGLKGTGSLAAKSYLNYGMPTNTPTRGDIAVFNDMSGRNDPVHGHVGFVDSIDSKKGIVWLVGGNQNNSVSRKAYPMSALAGFRRPPTADQVQQYAKQTGISNYQELAQIPNQINEFGKQISKPQTLSTNLGTAAVPPEIGKAQRNSLFKDPNTVLQTIRQFENFSPTTYWDVNAHRLGFGTDTITRADGSIIPVKKGMTVSREDAERDLSRRSNDFAKGVIKQVGQDNWDKFGPGTQAALTSIAYNYGSLPKRIIPAVKSGSYPEIAKAIRGLAGDNKGVNRHRRNKEANMVWDGQKTSMNNTTPTSPLAPPPAQPTPQEHRTYEDMMRIIDKGKDDYASLDLPTQNPNGVKSRINWGLLSSLVKQA